MHRSPSSCFPLFNRVCKPLLLALAVSLAAAGCGGGGGGNDNPPGTDPTQTINALPVGTGVVLFESSRATPATPRLLRLDPATGASTASATPCADVGNDLRSADLRPDGQVVAASYNVLYAIDLLNGRCQKLADGPAAATTGLAIAVAADGRIYAVTAEKLADERFMLYVFSANGSLLSSQVLSGAAIDLGFVKGIDFDANGALWMSAFNAHDDVAEYQMITIDPVTGVMAARFETRALQGDIDIGSDGLLRSHGIDKALHVINLGTGALTASVPTGLDADKALVYR